MEGEKNLWFTYEPIPHTDKGYIYCDGPVQLTAKVTRFDNGNKFSIEYEGQKNEEIDVFMKIAIGTNYKDIITNVLPSNSFESAVIDVKTFFS